jgi:hypothetical protein
MQGSTIRATVRGRQVELRLGEWGLMAMGEGHIVLHNHNEASEMYWKVILICIHAIQSVPSAL